MCCCKGGLAQTSCLADVCRSSACMCSRALTHVLCTLTELRMQHNTLNVWMLGGG